MILTTNNNLEEFYSNNSEYVIAQPINNYEQKNNSDSDPESVNFNFDDDDYGMSLFSSNNRALVVVSDEELFARKLEECEKNRNNELKLNGKFVNNLPEILKTFDWVTTMTLENTELNALTDNFPPNLIKLTCKHNNIKNLDASVLPDNLEILIYQHNNTTKITGLKNGIKELDVSNNMLFNINCEYPQNLTKLCVSNNKMYEPKLPFPDSLIEFIANDTNIRSIDNFGDNIEKLSTCRCVIKTVKKIPKNIKEWKNFVSRTQKIMCEFPEGMTCLDLFNNELEICPKLPKSMIDVDLSNNNLEEIPEFHENMKKIDFKQNSKLKTEDFKTIEKEMPNVNILYDTETNNDWSTNYNYYENYRPTYYKPNYRNNFGNWNRNNDENDPDVIILKKTYVL